MQKYIISILGIFVGIVAIAIISLTALCNNDWCNIFSWQKKAQPVPVVVQTFEQCARLNGVIMESYPRQCSYDDEIFVESIAEPKSFADCVNGGGTIIQGTIKRCLLKDREFIDEKNLPDTTNNPVKVNITSGDLISSPLEFHGEALGSWFFEASFPVELTDANGKVLGVTPAQAVGDWMQPGYVAFAGRLVFSKPTTTTGFIVFRKDNPSGLPENDGEFKLPVRFK